MLTAGTTAAFIHFLLARFDASAFVAGALTWVRQLPIACLNKRFSWRIVGHPEVARSGVGGSYSAELAKFRQADFWTIVSASGVGCYQRMNRTAEGIGR